MCNKVYVNDNLEFAFKKKPGFREATLNDLNEDLGCGGEAFEQPIKVKEGVFKFDPDTFEYKKVD